MSRHADLLELTSLAIALVLACSCQGDDSPQQSRAAGNTRSASVSDWGQSARSQDATDASPSDSALDPPLEASESDTVEGGCEGCTGDAATGRDAGDASESPTDSDLHGSAPTDSAPEVPIEPTDSSDTNEGIGDSGGGDTDADDDTIGTNDIGSAADTADAAGSSGDDADGGDSDAEGSDGEDSDEPDTGSPDTGSPDTGNPDTGEPDTGSPDTGPSDTGAEEVDTGPPPLPDLTLLAPGVGGLEGDEEPWLTEREFAADECVVEDACVNAPGVRRLLMFDTITANYGPADVDIGIPGLSDAFHFSDCYDHYVVTDHIIQHELRTSEGTIVATGHKQADCLADWDDFQPESSPTGGRYHCNKQGISWGYYDFYGTHLQCQWIDVTAVPAGEYTLFLEINRARVFEEVSYDNNTLELPVVIPALDLDGPCTGATDFDGPGRNCEWFAAPDDSCTPGNTVRVGCSDEAGCALGDGCSGDPMIRVCDGADPHCSIDNALAWSDDACDSNCPFAELTCPDSGQYRVWTAPYREDQAYSCALGSSETP